MFPTILHANDGSAPAFKALDMALALAKQNGSELHMVSVMEVDYMPEFVEEVRQETVTATKYFQKVLKRATATAEKSGVPLRTHMLTGHAVRDVLKLAEEIKADLLVIGAAGHTALYERMIGSRADRMVQLASCPVLVVK